MIEGNEALDALNAAVQEFANAMEGKAVLVSHAVVTWEQVSVDEDGESLRSMEYCVPTDNFTPSGTIGLMRHTSQRIERRFLMHADEDIE